MDILEAAQRLFAAGRAAEAVALVHAAAEGGDGEALFAVANWRLYGLHGERDPAASHALLERAAASGHTEGARLRAYLTASGTGVGENWPTALSLLREIAADDPDAAGQLRVLEAMPSPEAITSWPAERLHDSADIRLLRNFITPEEAAYLRALAEPHLRPSSIVHPASRRRVPHPTRTSYDTNFALGRETLVVNAINRRIAAATGTDFRAGEPLHILRYSGGQEYRPHLDGLPAAANQRLWTVLLYLNDDYVGGETEFPQLGLRVHGTLGDALIFRNSSDSGTVDRSMLHAGLPVRSGTKWLATRWIRARPFDPFVAD